MTFAFLLGYVQPDFVSASSSPGTTTGSPSPSAQIIEPASSSKAWIAGAVVGPILGLALVGVGVWLFLRRQKKGAQLPQHGSAAMGPIDPNSPPVGVGGYTDAKPLFHSAQPTYYDRPGQRDPYIQQGYPEQGGFSPAPQYGFQSAYNTTAQPGAYNHNTKYDDVDGTAELGSDDIGPVQSAPLPQAVGPVSELSGVDAKQPEKGVPDSSKL